MERKHIIEIIIAVLILLGLGVLLWWIFMRDTEVIVDEETTTDTVVEDTVDPFSETVDTSTLPDQPETIARAFVERFGSFSSESGYGNIDDVLTLATSGMQAQLESIAAEARAQGGDSYYGISTTILTIEELSRTEAEASFLITTQREESINSPANTTVRYQEIEVSLTANGDTWLVSGFAWGESL